ASTHPLHDALPISPQTRGGTNPASRSPVTSGTASSSQGVRQVALSRASPDLSGAVRVHSPLGGKLPARPVRHAVAMAKETPGDGSMLTPLRKGQALYRSMFGIEHDGVRYDVDVNFFDWDEE